MAYSKYMGARIKRKEDPRLITGSGVFTGDIKLPGMQYVAFVRSPYAHARIKSIDVSKALECSGVLAAITGKEIAERCAPMPFPFDSGASDEEANRLRTHHALTTERVRHSGEAVAALVAADPYIAEDAIESIVVDWEALKTVADIESAVASDAPVLFDDMEAQERRCRRRLCQCSQSCESTNVQPEACWSSYGGSLCSRMSGFYDRRPENLDQYSSPSLNA